MQLKTEKLLVGLFYLALFALSLGQFAVIGRGESGAFYIFDLILGIFSFSGIIFFLISGNFKMQMSQVFFILFGLVGAISLVKGLTTLSVVEFEFSAFYLIRWFIYLFSSVVLSNMLDKGYLSSQKFLTAIFVSAVFISIAGYIQLILLPDFTVLDASLGWDPHKNRLASTFFDPNFTGGYLTLCLGLAMGTFLYKLYEFDALKTVLFILLPLLALFLTFSRSSWGMFAVIILVLGMFKARWLLFLALFAGFLSYYAVPRVQTRLSGITDPADSAVFRLVSWKNTFEIAKDNLWLGVGFNSFRFVQKEYGHFEEGTFGGNAGGGSDSSLLLVLATTGVVGLSLFILGGVFMFDGLSVGSAGFVITLALFMGLFLHSQFVNSLFYPQILFLWLNLGVLKKIIKKAPTRW